MAMSKPDDLQEEIQCVLCLCTMEDPRALPCLHTFCLECLRHMEEGNKIKCPNDRSITRLGAKGVDGLPKNFLMNTLIEREHQRNVAVQPTAPPQIVLSYASVSQDESHDGVECNACGVMPLPGLRYKCLTCPNYNLCGICRSSNSHNHHKMFFIKPPSELAVGPAHAGVECAMCKQNPLVGNRYKCLSCPNYSLCLTCKDQNLMHSGHRTFYIKPPEVVEPGDTHRGISCSLCKQRPLAGTRYKCTKCWNYNLCTTCHAQRIFVNEHQKDHIMFFIRPPKEADVGDPHPGVMCSQCKQKPLFGIRYVCCTCLEYTLCKRCKEQNIYVNGHQKDHKMYYVRPPRKADIGELHYNARCHVCEQKPLVGTRYKCTECTNYSLCKSCFDQQICIEPHTCFHEIFYIRTPKEVAFGLRHPGITCDMCQQRHLVGIRYKCMTCENYNLCKTCKDQEVYMDGHISSHDLLHILPPKESENGLPHPGIMCSQCQRNPLLGIRYKCSTCSDYNLCSSCMNKDLMHNGHEAIFINPPEAHAARNVHLGVRCSLCKCMPLVGTRYKCAECNDYNLCKTCKDQKLYIDGHGEEHIVFYIRDSKSPGPGEAHAGVECSLCKRMPLEGNRYKCLKCTKYNLCESCHDQKVYVDGHQDEHTVVYIRTPKKADVGDPHPNVQCRLCEQEPLRGIWYRCKQCQNYNLCSSCKAQNIALDGHLVSHDIRPVNGARCIII